MKQCYFHRHPKPTIQLTSEQFEIVDSIVTDAMLFGCWFRIDDEDQDSYLIRSVYHPTGSRFIGPDYCKRVSKIAIFAAIDRAARAARVSNHTLLEEMYDSMQADIILQLATFGDLYFG